MGTTAMIAGSGIVAADMLSLRMLLIASFIIMSGVLLARWEGGTQQKNLTILNDKIFIPCLVFTAINRNPPALSEIILITAVSASLVFFSYPLARCWVRREAEVTAAGYIPMLFGSTGTLLLPLAYLLFGTQGLSKAVFFHLASIFLLSTWGMKISGQPSRFLFFLKMPALYAVILALILESLNIMLPLQFLELVWLVEKGIGMMASGAIPILLMSHGYALYGIRSTGGAAWSQVALLRMIWFPATAAGLVFILRITGISDLDKGYDLLKYLDLRTTEAIILFASVLPSTISTRSLTLDKSVLNRSNSLVFSSFLLSFLAFVVVLFMINRYIFNS